ncbi:putative DNA polymerase epsilon p17 subunit [Neospora caninum Liverpool]|nr:putative DNA polymerase epsilon p17 subunit [Neospora caninum Liverpool]CBZ50267.1 putative DNA polymerase epsilon p17 subunit [Neospora caninum Liverpool]|eukprot:XP_003880301.1 putative DNA polymerase epsilon p17 subunit [Neospora caninum Liverpool]
MGYDKIAADIEEHMRCEAEGYSRGSEVAHATNSGVHTTDENSPTAPAIEALNSSDAETEDRVLAVGEGEKGRSRDGGETDEELSGEEERKLLEEDRDEEQGTDALDAMMQVVEGVLAEHEPYSEGQADPVLQF